MGTIDRNKIAPLHAAGSGDDTDDIDEDEVSVSTAASSMSNSDSNSDSDYESSDSSSTASVQLTEADLARISSEEEKDERIEEIRGAAPVSELKKKRKKKKKKKMTKKNMVKGSGKKAPLKKIRERDESPKPT